MKTARLTIIKYSPASEYNKDTMPAAIRFLHRWSTFCLPKTLILLRFVLLLAIFFQPTVYLLVRHALLTRFYLN